MHANLVQKSLENATWDAFGTKTRPGRVKLAPTAKNYYSRIDLLGRKCRSRGELWLQKSFENCTWDAFSVKSLPSRLQGAFPQPPV